MDSTFAAIKAKLDQKNDKSKRNDDTEWMEEPRLVSKRVADPGEGKRALDM